MRCHSGGLFMTDVHGAKHLDTADRHVDHRSASDVKGGIHPLVLKRLDDQIVAADLCHGWILLAIN